MKKLLFTRTQILRAIHAAAVALFLAATSAARAQTAAGDGSGNVTISGSGTEFHYTGLNPNLADGGTLTIDSGSTITNTASGFVISLSAAATLNNHGTLAVDDATGGSTLYFSESTATATTISNTGSVTSEGNTGAANSASGIYAYNSGTGAVSLTNSGTISGDDMAGTGQGAVLHSQGGSVSLTNSSTGTISGTGQAGYGAALTTGPGSIVATNSGSVYGSRDGMSLDSDTGSATITNSGSIVGGSEDGILLITNGPTTLTNSGTITGSGYGVFLETVSATVTNSGILTGTSNSGLYVGANTIDITNTATGTITNSSQGITAREYNAGSLTVLNAGTITGTVLGIEAFPFLGSTATVTNTGTISASSIGILLHNPGTVINSGSISGNTAINVPSGSSVTLAGAAATTGTVLGGADASSTSTLHFNLAIPSANLAAAQNQLDTEIAAYNTQHGGQLTFTIDGRSFDISNFLFDGGVTDDLVTLVNRLYANTPGYSSLGTSLDNIDTSSVQGAAIHTALGNVADANVPNALAEISPKSLQVFQHVADDNNGFTRTTVDNHLANRRDGLTGFDSSALTINTPGVDPSLSQVRSHLLAFNPPANSGLISDSIDSLFGGTDMKDMKSARVNTMPTDRWSTFIAGNVILADLSRNGPLADANYTTGAVTAGVDYRLDEHFTVGAVLSYAHTGIDLDDRGSKATVDSYSPGIYASYVDGGWYGNGLATYVRNAYTEDRRIDIPGLEGTNHGATSGNQATANLTGGYEFHKGSFKFGPVASVEYVHLAIQSMQEDGPTSLDIDKQNEDSFRSLLGFEGRFVANVSSPVGLMTLTPHLTASWQHEYLEDSRGINSQFTGAGGGSFTTQTDAPQRDAALIDVGLDATINRNVTVFVDYGTQVGQSNFFAQSAQAGVRVSF